MPDMKDISGSSSGFTFDKLGKWTFLISIKSFFVNELAIFPVALYTL